MNQHPQNSNVYGKQYVTNYAPTNHGERAAATSYLERNAPDLLGMNRRRPHELGTG